jgi:hypothetical protein
MEIGFATSKTCAAMIQAGSKNLANRPMKNHGLGPRQGRRNPARMQRCFP